MLFCFTDSQGYYQISGAHEYISMDPIETKIPNGPMNNTQQYQNVNSVQLPPKSTNTPCKLFRSTKTTLAKQRSQQSFDNDTRTYQNLDTNGNRFCTDGTTQAKSDRSPPSSAKKRQSFEQSRRLYKSCDDNERYQNLSLSNYKFY